MTKKSTSTSKLPENDFSRPKKSKSGSRNMPAKSPKIFRLRAKSVKKRHQSTPAHDVVNEAESGSRRLSMQRTLFDSDQGFIITPPESFSGTTVLPAPHALSSFGLSLCCGSVTARMSFFHALSRWYFLSVSLHQIVIAVVLRCSFQLVAHFSPIPYCRRPFLQTKLSPSPWSGAAFFGLTGEREGS